MLVQLAHPDVHQRIGGDPEGDRSVGTHPGAQSSARHGLHQKIKTFPRVFLAILDHHFHQRRSRKIDHSEPGAVDQRRDRQRHAGLHPHAPQALLTIAHGFIKKFNMGHWGSLLLERGQSFVFQPAR